MVGIKLLLLLFGTTIASCHFLKNALIGNGPNHLPMVYSNPGLSPFVTHLPSSNGNIIYKPEFVIPPLIERLVKSKLDCVKDGLTHYLPVMPEMVVKKPLNPKEFTVVVPKEAEVVIEHQPIHIPEPPVLPPFTMPEMPIIVEEPKITAPEQNIHVEPIVLKENCKPLEIPAPPMLPTMPEMPIVPVLSEFGPLPAPEYIPVEIPEPPMLPPLSLQELPVPIFTEVIPENKPAIIPEAPILPPLPNHHISDLILNEIPKGPTLPPFVMPPFPEIVVEEKHLETIPQPPELLLKPEAPLPSPSFVEVAAPSKCIYDIPEAVPNSNVIPEFQPIIIPEPPVLPPFVMPELPTFAPIKLPELPGFEHIYQNVDDKPIKAIEIPPAPVLAPLEIPAPLPNIVKAPQVFIPEHHSITEVIPEPCDKNERIPEHQPILILEQTHPVRGVTTQEVVPELMVLNVGGEKVTIPSLGSLSFPNFCVQNLIIDRALPSMIIGEKHFAKTLAPYAVGQHSTLPMFQYYKK